MKTKLQKMLNCQNPIYYWLDLQVVEKLYDIGIHDLKIIEDQNLDLDENSESLEGEDTLTILNRYIEETEIALDKTDLKNIIKSIYVEACEVQ